MSIILDHVSYIYGEDTPQTIRALDDINLVIPDGQFIGIIGHTGSGKSTLMQHLNGLVQATEGHIYYNGEDIYDEEFDRKKLRSKVGLVFQYPEHQLFEIDVFSDVCFGPKIWDWKKRKWSLEPMMPCARWDFRRSFFISRPLNFREGRSAVQPLRVYLP